MVVISYLLYTNACMLCFRTNKVLIRLSRIHRIHMFAVLRREILRIVGYLLIELCFGCVRLSRILSKRIDIVDRACI